MLDILEFGFMQRALVSGGAIAILCPVVGMFLVLRRYSLFGDAIAHSSFGGIALGLLAGIYPLWTAYIAAIAGALLITRIRESFDISGDAAVAVLLSSGIAIGLVLIGLSGGFTIDIFGFLFGSILLVSVDEAVLAIAMSASIILVILYLYRQLLYATFSEEQAMVAGVRVRAINYVVVVMAGITAVTSIQLVGVLLVSALFVIPNVTAIMYGRGFARTVMISVIFSVSAAISGIFVSYILDITPAGTIVLVSVGMLAGTMVFRRARALRLPSASRP